MSALAQASEDRSQIDELRSELRVAKKQGKMLASQLQHALDLLRSARERAASEQHELQTSTRRQLDASQRAVQRALDLMHRKEDRHNRSHDVLRDQDLLQTLTHLDGPTELEVTLFVLELLLFVHGMLG